MFYAESSYYISEKIAHTQNGDRAFELRFETKPTNDNKIYIQCVLDGVSSANDKYSSGLAAEILCEKLTELIVNINGIANLSENDRMVYFYSVMRNAILAADRRLFADPEYCATTVSIAIIYGEYVYTSNIGDSPIYLADTGSLELFEIYTSHNDAGIAARKGLTIRSEAELRKKKCHLNKSVGGKELLSDIDIPTKRTPLPRDGIVILGSDGALSFLSQQELKDIIFEGTENMKMLCENLYYTVAEKGGYDDFTVFATRIKTDI